MCAVFHSADLRARIQGAIRFQRLHVEAQSDRGAAQPVRRRLLRRHGGPSALLPVVLYIYRNEVAIIDHRHMPLQPYVTLCSSGGQHFACLFNRTFVQHKQPILIGNVLSVIAFPESQRMQFIKDFV